MTLPARCPPHLLEAQRAGLWSRARLAGPRRPGDVFGIPAETRATPADDDAPVGTPGRRSPGWWWPATAASSCVAARVAAPRRARRRRQRAIRDAPIREVHFSKFAGDGHSKTVFPEESAVRGGLAVTTSLDRSLVAWDVGKLARAGPPPGSAGSRTTPRVDPEDPGASPWRAATAPCARASSADTDDDPNASGDSAARRPSSGAAAQTKAARRASPADPASGRLAGGARSGVRIPRRVGPGGRPRGRARTPHTRGDTPRNATATGPVTGARGCAFPGVSADS